MSAIRMRRHLRRCLDASISKAHSSLAHDPVAAETFERLLAVVRARSTVLRAPPTRRGVFLQVEALRNLAAWSRQFLRGPEEWAGGPRGILPVVSSLGSHLLGHYPSPRFLASAWFGPDDAAANRTREWFVAHVRGARFRDLSLPLALTRRMEHVFLTSPDHYPVGPALRRAEVRGLGGSDGLVARVLESRLGGDFEQPDFWRHALAWLVRWEREFDPVQIGPIIDFLRAARAAKPTFELSGRTPVSLMREVVAWHRSLGQASFEKLVWKASRWNEFHQRTVVPEDPERTQVEWRIVELCDSLSLVREGRAMRHCVASYATKCARGLASIWSLRRQIADHEERSIVTIEIDPTNSTIVQARGAANSRPTGAAVELLRAWARSERLFIPPTLGFYLSG